MTIALSTILFIASPVVAGVTVLLVTDMRRRHIGFGISALSAIVAFMFYMPYFCKDTVVPLMSRWILIGGLAMCIVLLTLAIVNRLRTGPMGIITSRKLLLAAVGIMLASIGSYGLANIQNCFG